MEKYIYFVSFCHIDKYGNNQFGNAEMLLDKPIEHIEAVTGVTKWIEQNCNANDVIVLNYVLLRKENSIN